MNGFTGSVSKNYKIVGTDISKMSVIFDTNQNYDGTAKEPVVKVFQKATSKTPERVFEFGSEYTVTYDNNINAGKKATVIIKGINGCSGTIKKTFTINQKSVSGFEMTVAPAIYQKGGSKPTVTLMDGANELVLGTDYTVVYSNNTKVHDGIATKTPIAKITGKGNYTGTLSKTFAIAESNLDNVSITSGDIIYQNKSGICKPVIKLIDSDGKMLSSGTDYDKAITYKYAKPVTVSQVVDAKKKIYKDVPRAEGEIVNDNDIIPVGASITAYVTGKGFYSGSKEVTFRYVLSDVSRATIVVVAQSYTGKAVSPTKDDITVKIGKEILKKTDYEIVDFNKNVEKGSAEITIRGVGDYGGLKTSKFSIIAKSIN